MADLTPSQYPWQVPYPDNSPFDDERERRRLAANYATMTDGELQRLALNAESLTELAWDALDDEMDRRHIDVADDPAPSRIRKWKCANW